MDYFLSIFLGTFVLEDVAIATSLVFVAEQKMSLAAAFAACFLGISLGDFGLYLLGSLASRFEFGFLNKKTKTWMRTNRSSFMEYSIVVSRVIPGTRLPTYLGAGFLGYSGWRFLLLTLASVLAWVSLVLFGGHVLVSFFSDHWILGLALFFLSLKVIKSAVLMALDPWKRKAWFHSWRKWTHFEFWPAPIFYFPVVMYYIYLSLRGRNLLLPFYANPQVLNGGLIGESKWDFLKRLQKEKPETIPCVFISKETSSLNALKIIEDSGITTPYVLKPDVGQRGYGVRIIRDKEEAQNYLNERNAFAVLAQKLSTYPHEAGVFYFRRPSESVGQIFSITEKIFPTVTGDGKRKLGDLILQDRRARIMATVYFSRHREQLNTVVPEGVHVVLSECGNHCQGAVFKNGEDLLTPALAAKIDVIAKSIPDFYFGRLDLRYKNKESFMGGEDFEIVEINGAGSEATHIWDSDTRLLEAYRVLRVQWKTLFEIGAEIRRQNPKKTHIQIFQFFRDCLKIFCRDDSFSISS